MSGCSKTNNYIPRNKHLESQPSNLSEEQWADKFGDGKLPYQKLPVLNTPRESERTIEGPQGSYVILGGDRANTQEGFKFGAGKAGLGYFASAHIDLVAGLASVSQYEGKVPDVPVNPDTHRDAARVYISQNCDVDELFGIQGGSVKNVKDSAVVVAKADQVYLLGREGVKIISGTGKTNSKGRCIHSVGPIDLIAGDASAVLPSGKPALQPVVRGYHMELCVQGLIDRIKQVNGALTEFVKFQTKFNSALAFHKHDDLVSQGICGILNAHKRSYFEGMTKVGSVDPGDERVASEGTSAVLAGADLIKDLAQITIALDGAKVTYTNHGSDQWICSRQVRTT